MRAHYFQHVPFEGLGSIHPWLLNTGFEISCTRFYASDAIPELDEIDLLIIMGGPMSVKDESLYPWLKVEKEFIGKAIEKRKAVLGICLGAQLIASAMGGDIFPNPEKEIGWFPVKAVTSAKGKGFSFPEELEVFHWHGETFSLPENAIHLARNKVCTNQAFQMGDRVIGLQFHLETTPEFLQEIIGHCRDELSPGAYIQTEEEMCAFPPEKFERINAVMGNILEYIARKIPRG